MIQDELERSGNWLFRRRSYLPILFFVAILGWLPFQDHVPQSRSRWLAACFVISGAGISLRIVTVGYAFVGSSGRNTGRHRAKYLNTSGTYSVVRHPLYLGNYLICLGVVLYADRLTISVVYSLSFWLYYERIICSEERFLVEKFGSRYLDWSSRTAAFIPRNFHWRPPENAFAWRRVLRREYSSLLTTATGFFLVELEIQLLRYPEFSIQTGCCVLLILALGVYLFLRLLKKKTDLLTCC